MEIDIMNDAMNDVINDVMNDASEFIDVHWQMPTMPRCPRQTQTVYQLNRVRMA